MKKKWAVILAGAVLGAGIAPQVMGITESAVPFLLISPGARASGMGEAFAAVADDATAVFWNPAGLAFQRGREITLMHANWLPQLTNDMFFDFAAYRQSVEGLGTFGINVTYLNMGKQYITGEESPDILGEFTSFDFAVALTYGTLVSKNTAVGVGLRYIRSNLSPVGAGAERGEGKANAFAVDLAFLYRAPWLEGFRIGANLSNMGPKITYIDAAQADPLPTNLKLGLSYDLVNSQYNRLTLAADANKLLVRRYKDGTSDPFYKAIFTAWTDEPLGTEFRNMIYSGGVEYVYSNLFALRGGYYYDQEGQVKYATFGAGIQYHLYRFDFAYVSAKEGHPLSDTMRFSLTIGF
ncbi:MAG: type IX secretion system outer membrane channel protein PorV [candidate division KSB1 bacterium]|nr:type IX secretion system outer membrane channel protein PorV [candidate division KSB1 bacterium]